jgi:23S rRNA (uracil1939-C5)-methyltransferase
MTKKFNIVHLDPMGQGVSKIDDKITFIAKTLPGEEGDCEVYQSKKGVQFASLKKLKKHSNKRMESECPHFQDCPSCHYLHTSYEEELGYKQSSIQKELSKLPLKNEIEIIPAEARFGYRNRIQLHYDLHEEKMGYQDIKNNRIIEVPNCLLPLENIQKKIKALYQHKFKDFPQNKSKGHIEIYLNAKTKNVETAFNKPYAHAGFTQVNSDMNDKALKLIHSIVTPLIDENSTIVDLFGGQGNLSREFATNLTFVVDNYHPKYIPKDDIQKFISLDLFKTDSENILAKSIKKQCDILIIDPPRSGFKNIKKFIELLKPKHIFYMSCKASTMARDFISIEEDFEIQREYLLDFFPGTFHYESLIYGKLKEK